MPNYPTHACWGRGGAVLAAIAVGASVYVQFVAAPLSIAAAAGLRFETLVGAGLAVPAGHLNRITRVPQVLEVRPCVHR